MSIFWGLDNFCAPEPGVAVTIGSFDGVHLGHQALLERLIRLGKERGLPAVAVTFDRHPLEVIAPEKAPPLIQTPRERMRRLAASGVQSVLALHFDEAMAQMAAEDFVRGVLLERIHMKAAIVGENFRFGRRRRGDPELLRRMGEQEGFDVEVLPALVVDGRPVSSTLVRRTVMEGDVRLAARLLGECFRVTGTVVHGDGRGRQIGFPTANVDVPVRRLVPGNGVYAVNGRFGAENATLLRGAANIGTRPTVGGISPVFEAHLIGFTGDLYGQELEVLFLDRLRDEKKFASLDELIGQIGRDVSAALRTPDPELHTAAT